jgi:GNAT superfamily N-acetyltransferase
MQFTVRPATLEDCEDIAQVHVASIRSLGAQTYDAEIVSDWSAFRTGERYARAMEDGVLFFVAIVHEGHKHERIAGFSSYSFVRGKHRTAIYVNGDFARCGVGTALFTAAEDAARKNGATEIDIDASIGAVLFYRAMGFEELGTGQHALNTGRKMACVVMRKRL